jgi:hypothetical protein
MMPNKQILKFDPRVEPGKNKEGAGSSPNSSFDHSSTMYQ